MIEKRKTNIIDVTNIYYTEDGSESSTQFDTQDEGELATLWWEFCKENDLISIEKGRADYNSGVLLEKSENKEEEEEVTSRDVLTFGGKTVCVDARWLHDMCREFAKEDMKYCSKSPDADMIETYADAIYENMDEDTASYLALAAMSDAKSKILVCRN